MNSGYYDEAREWRAWLVRAVAGSPAQLQIMYGLAGERRLAEWEIPWLSGYEGSKPVRIGNAAHEQLQLDVYGEVMDAFYQARRGGLGAVEGGPEMARAFLEHLEQIWRQPDEGIWEVRRWREVRDAIHKDVCENGYDADLGSFVQSYGSKQLDASLLQIPCLGFLPPEDKRVRGTVMAVERNLVEDGLVKRYHTGKSKDGLPPGEGAFLACSFWLADAYVMVGRHDDAAELFERLLALRNDVGLLSEEYDVKAGRQVGNFPQAFSHLALVNTAHNLTLAEKPARQRAHG
jgi:GH15 family glucan-1,4-alpha-glucosidase